MPTSPLLRIAIIGGGIGGLALAHDLEGETGVSVTVYERDKDAVSRAQGYAIGINTEGLSALRSACRSFLPDLEELTARKYLMAGICMADRNLRSLFRITWKADASKSTTVNRWELRRLMASKLLQNQEGDAGRAGIFYDKRFVGYSVVPDDDDDDNDGDGVQHHRVVARFEDGTTTPPVDILVGADGSWSRIRRALYPSIEYKPLGVANIAGALPLDEALSPGPGIDAPPRLGSVIFAAPPGDDDDDDDQTSCLARVVDRAGSSLLLLLWEDPQTLQPWLLWSVTCRIQQGEETKTLEARFRSSAAAAPAVLDENSHGKCNGPELHAFCLDNVRSKAYTPEIVDLIQRTGVKGMLDTVGWQVYSIRLPSKRKRVELVDAAVRGPRVPVLVLGDAAHATSTHAGLGANAALQDAQDLAKRIRERILWQRRGLIDELARYQLHVFARGADVISKSTSGTSMATAAGWGALARDWCLRFAYLIFRVGRRLRLIKT